MKIRYYKGTAGTMHTSSPHYQLSLHDSFRTLSLSFQYYQLNYKTINFPDSIRLLFNAKLSAMQTPGASVPSVCDKGKRRWTLNKGRPFRKLYTRSQFCPLLTDCTSCACGRYPAADNNEQLKCKFAGHLGRKTI
jgi:hypothetical protein